MQLLNKIEDISTEEWWNLYNKSETSNIFQSPDMFEFWLKIENNTPFVIAVKSNNGQLVALCSGVIMSNGGKLKQFFTKRAIVYGGPLLTDDLQATKLLLNNIDKYIKNKAIYIETRNLNNYTNYKSVFKKCSWNYKAHLNFHVDCSNENAMNKAMSKSKLRQIKKSKKNGANIIEATNESQVFEFYKILENLYNTKIKTPLPNFSFFKTFFYSNLGKYLLVVYNEKIIGGIMCPISNNTIYEWYVCGIDKQIKDVYPSIMATYAAMEYASKNNISRFDFMGAGKPEEEYGVREFKSKFGGELVEHGRFIKIYNKILYNLGSLAVKILKKH